MLELGVDAIAAKTAKPATATMKPSKAYEIQLGKRYSMVYRLLSRERVNEPGRQKVTQPMTFAKCLLWVAASGADIALSDGMVAVAEYPSGTPAVCCLVPNNQEFCFPKALFGFDIAECLIALFNGTKPFDRVNLEATGG